MSNSRLKRDKRAYIAYLNYLLKEHEKDSDMILEDDTHIDLEIFSVEQHLKDLNFVIEVEEQKAEAG